MRGCVKCRPYEVLRTQNDYRITRVVHRLSLDIIATGSVMLTNDDVVIQTFPFTMPSHSDYGRELLEVEDVEQHQRLVHGTVCKPLLRFRSVAIEPPAERAPPFNFILHSASLVTS
jgi:hypothetical protein